MFKGKKVLVAGGSGMIGRPLVEMLLDCGAIVRVASLDSPVSADPRTEFRRVDLLHFGNCLSACEGMDYVFNLLGVKGSPAAARKHPASFFVPILTLDTDLMEAARQCGVERYLFTSSIGVYPSAEVFREEDAWKSPPSPNDKFAGWAKRMGELQAEAYAIEFGWDRVAVVRPANVYGPFDNFSLENAMVVPSLIRRIACGENPLRVWGDGTADRDFVYADDVARGMLLAIEALPKSPINLGSGSAVSIRRLVEILTELADVPPKVEWDSSQPAGDGRRVMDISRARAIGYAPEVRLSDGLRRTVDWYRHHGSLREGRYDVFAGDTVRRPLL